MQIRRTSEADWQMLQHLRLAALLDAPAAFGLTYSIAAAYSEAQWRERAGGRSEPIFWLALDQHQPLGLIGGITAPDQPGEYHLISLWVAPAARGRGVGDALIAAVQAHARSTGFPRVALRVAPDNLPAVTLYQRHGFAFRDEWVALQSHPEIAVQTMVWLATA